MLQESVLARVEELSWTRDLQPHPPRWIGHTEAKADDIHLVLDAPLNPLHQVSRARYGRRRSAHQLWRSSCVENSKTDMANGGERNWGHALSLALYNALGIGVGFTVALLCLGSVREILGSATLLSLTLLGDSFRPWVVMILPPRGFFVAAAWLLLFAYLIASAVQLVEMTVKKLSPTLFRALGRASLRLTGLCGGSRREAGSRSEMLSLDGAWASGAGSGG